MSEHRRMKGDPDLFEVNRKIEALIELVNSQEGFFGRATGRVLINCAEMQSCINAIKNALPDAITQAQQVLQNRDEIERLCSKARQDIEEKRKTTEQAALQKANQIIEQAKNEAEVQAKQILEKAHNEEQEILLDATQRRQGIITKAHQQAKELIEQEEIYKQAQQKAEALLTKAQSTIDAAYQSVERQIDYIFDSAESVLAQQQNQIRSSKNNILRILENPQNESELNACE